MVATVVEISLELRNTVFERTLNTIPESHVVAEKTVSHSTDALAPLIWAWSPDSDGFREELRRDPSVEDAVLASSHEGWRLYRVRLTGDPTFLSEILTEERGALLSAWGSADGWQLRILVPDRSALSRIVDYYADRDVRVTVRSVRRLNSDPEAYYGLTPGQYEALTTAAELGYFEVPRQCTMGEVAREMGLSQQALSEQLRRAFSNLVRTTLVVDETVENRPQT